MVYQTEELRKTSMNRAELAAADRDIIAEIWTSSEAHDNLVTLCEDFGSRFGGTEGEKGVRDFLLRRMAEYGLENVHAEEFPYNGWRRGTLKLETLEPVQREVEAIALPYTGTAALEGELVYVGHGTPRDFEAHRAEIQGRMVMTTSRSPLYQGRTVQRLEKYGQAVAAGAKAFLMMRETGGLLASTGSLRYNQLAEIPGLGLSRETGESLLRLARKGPVKLRLTTQNTVEESSSWNVVGEIPGQLPLQRVIVIGAHFDGHDIGQGALDDGAGTVTVLEIARTLARYRGRFGATLRFVCFAIEELGLIGSQAYVAHHADELNHIIFMLNLDGAAREMEIGLAVQGWSKLVEPLKAVASDIQEPLLVNDRVGLYSDMFSFTVAGVPSAGLIPAGPRERRGFSHTAADTVDKVSPKNLRRDAILIARLLLRLANWEEWPAHHKTPAEIEHMLEERGLAEVLRWEGRYPF
jgi:Zn-dependent M28 family amino/carboxypeptidase